MIQLLDISAKRMSHQGKWPTSKRFQAANRKQKRLKQEVLFIDERYLEYTKQSFGDCLVRVGLWNETDDFKKIVFK